MDLSEVFVLQKERQIVKHLLYLFDFFSTIIYYSYLLNPTKSVRKLLNFEAEFEKMCFKKTEQALTQT